MPSADLRDPVSRYTAQVRLEASDEQWSEIEPHLIRFETPSGLTLFDWPNVVDVVGRIAKIRRPAVLRSPRRTPTNRSVAA
jgi:hypothetical protein